MAQTSYGWDVLSVKRHWQEWVKRRFWLPALVKDWLSDEGETLRAKLKQMA